jgi:hypothetical protein
MQAQCSDQSISVISGTIPSPGGEASRDPLASSNFLYQAATVVAILLFLLTF